MFRYSSFFFRFFVFSGLMLGVALTLGNLFFAEGRDVAADASEKAPVYTIILDAGHGGRDGGAVADDDGTLEKALNLMVAKRLQALFESADVRVVMTRETDTEMASPDSPHKKQDDLNARLAIAANCENAVFVSVHMNKFPVEKYRGLQVYYSDNHENSRLLAETIQEGAAEFLKNTGARSVKSAGDNIYLMAKLDIPAVLVECGFLSNYEEKELLKTEAYQKKLSMSIFSSVMRFLSENEPTS